MDYTNAHLQMDTRCLDASWLALQENLLPHGHEYYAGASTVTIFDWDDTILCTSVLDSLGFPSEVPGGAKSAMQQIEDQAVTLLTQALCLGPTYIVTNAMSGWVEASAAKHLPGLVPLLSKVLVISARGAYSYLYPDQPGIWKMCAFFNLVRDTDFHQFTDLIVIGDSFYEMDAAQSLCVFFANLRVKLIKLKELPSLDDVVRQLTMVLACYGHVAGVQSELMWRLDQEADLQAILSSPGKGAESFDVHSYQTWRPDQEVQRTIIKL
eukprot:TRINITY_DN11215_c0_g1_i2.p1 TRINITY_DN11215_c0_g1~~TRINITY_DN11215_c0_g1_i2.p1  ORF type:complete len:267 (-),score=54.43 TRINITY_DN11215_c0_g1_i2:35-835(-)